MNPLSIQHDIRELDLMMGSHRGPSDHAPLGPVSGSHAQVAEELNRRLIDRTAAYMAKFVELECALKKAESILQFWLEHNRDAEVPMYGVGRDTLEALRLVKAALKHENNVS